MCFDMVSKNPELAGTLPDDLRPAFETMVSQGFVPQFEHKRSVGWILKGVYVPPPGTAQPTCVPRAAAPGKRKSRLIPWDSVTVGEEPEFFIEGILPREGLGVIYGPPKSYKTFLVLDWAAHIARGQPYRGREVQQSAVMYCAFEGQHGFAKRVEAYRRTHLADSGESVPIHLQPIRLNFSKEVGDLIATVREAGVEPGLVVLDTLNRSLVGSESKDVDMTAYLAAADELRQAFNCPVLIVHHSGLEGGRPRGHSSLTGAADVQVSTLRQGEVSTTTVEFMKDGPEGATLYSKLEIVDVGHGKTSCVIVEAGELEQEKKAPKRDALAGTMLRVLQQGGPLPLTEWNARSAEAATPAPERYQLTRARKALDDHGLVLVLDDGRWDVAR
jgi:hypothetical protein